MENDGAWLVDGKYQDFVRSLCYSDPRLRQRDPKAVTERVPFTDDGVRVVKLSLKNGAFARMEEFDKPVALKSHFHHTASHRGRQNIYIAEGLGPGFAGVLGERFSLHPSFFVEHERVVVHNLNPDGESDGVQLPSTIQRRGHLEMKYYEVVTFDRSPTSFRWVCAATGRHIGISRGFTWGNSPDEIDNYLKVGVVRRKCGVWSRRTEGGGWDCLVLCDPPVKRIKTGDGYSVEHPVKTGPYQGGYLDFVPEEEQIRVAKDGRYHGPPRTSMLEDLSFYLQVHSRLVDIAEPESVNVFVKKIIASHFLKQTEHLRATLSAVQRGLTRKQDLAKMPMNKVEALWSDMQGWERRTGEYLEDLEGIMLQLGIPLSPPMGTANPTVGTPTPRGALSAADMAWQDCAADFQFLYLRFRELRHRTETLNAAVTGLASITGNRQAYKEQQRSIREAKSTKAVTLLGLVFIPLAYTSSLFGMEKPYGPGHRLFWVYFVTSAPLILVVLMGYYVLDFGYNDNGRAWSLKTFKHSVNERWGWLKRQDPDKDPERLLKLQKIKNVVSELEK
ncbi:hypothetical protein CCHL11_05797 [Colletotrichum chlorophyti]|uniref:Uncharacterized protein n=1 Tax=Colletotrichum chlorophyti TaxID=708187 RepID=A0A1Q8RMN9_9PEZI|nr:hypothetical protein CCHL11_05797 [Colletotrichum chlorophyti]